MNWWSLAIIAPIVGSGLWLWRSEVVRSRDFRAGVFAFRDGLPMNVGWSDPKRDGWVEAWVARRQSTRRCPWPTK